MVAKRMAMGRVPAAYSTKVANMRKSSETDSQMTPSAIPCKKAATTRIAFLSAQRQGRERARGKDSRDLDSKPSKNVGFKLPRGEAQVGPYRSGEAALRVHARGEKVEKYEGRC